MDQQVISLIRMKGPVVPTQISKEIKRDSLMTSAILSQLVDTKKLKISKLKVGGSPLYFLDGQEQRLQSFVKHLDEKDQKTVALLRDQKIMRDDKQPPLIRVSLRTIKDFAVPLQVTLQGKQIMFWKWYLLPDAEAEPMIKNMLGLTQEQVKEPEKQRDPPVEKQPVKKPVEKQPPTSPKAMVKQEPTPVQQQLPSKKIPLDDGDFYKSIAAFFSTHKIILHHSEKVRKTEFEFEITLPSVVGDLLYYCKAIQKNKINEKDLSEVYVRAQFRKLPAVLITTGDLTKKAKDMLAKELKGLTVKQI